jgi:murein DD-endopeptidase MepM/ murein hydrolase activator NlpD
MADVELWDDLVTTVFRRPERHDTRPDYDFVPRLATAIEPAIISRPPQSWRTLILAIAAVLAMAGTIGVGAHLYQQHQVRLERVAVFESTSPDPEDDFVERHSRVVMTPEESSRAVHSRSAAYRDLWRSTVWYHPLGDEVFMPGHNLRKFGAKRPGRRPSECGRGHCGVDLGLFGLPVRAAKDGVVERVQNRPTRKEGRYIRILHDDGFVSYYMHLHRIRDDLKAGMRVTGGEEIGVVGRTGIRRSPPHLHFALAYREGRQKIFIDPEPLLRRSVAVEEPDVVF